MRRSDLTGVAPLRKLRSVVSPVDRGAQSEGAFMPSFTDAISVSFPTPDDLAFVQCTRKLAGAAEISKSIRRKVYRSPECRLPLCPPTVS
jgi:hypothetical protein